MILYLRAVDGFGTAAEEQELPDLPRYEALWEEVCSILFAFTPLVQPLEMGRAVCDLSGFERRWRDAGDAANEIAARVMQCGITPWLGIASNWLVAELASAVVGPDGTVSIVEEGQERTFLADLPLASLPDIDPRMALAFQVLGLRTIGQFAALPASAVRQRFGTAGEKLHRYARGIDPRPVVPPPDRLAVTADYACKDGSIEEAIAAIHRLAETCAAELRRRHLAGRMISLKVQPLERPSGNTITPQISPHPRPLSHAGRGAGGEGIFEGPELPIPYRIHSMLPQPGNRGNAAEQDKATALVARDKPLAGQRRMSASHPYAGARERSLNELEDYKQLTAHPTAQPGATQLTPRRSRGLHSSPHGAAGGYTAHTATRTPVDEAGPIAEHAQRLLLRLWPPGFQLQSIGLAITEFPPPSQLSFPELDRIDQAGALRGMDAVRRQALGQQEQVLAARYGDASFRHVAHIDPTSILTERRFRWDAGLPLSMREEPTAGRSLNTAGRRLPLQGRGDDQAVL
jgi:hypothetical protein